MSTLTDVGKATSRSSAVEHWSVRIRGRVQGVGYCDACVQVARRIGVTGWVRNRRDGSIEVDLCGTAEQLHVMRQCLADGPPEAEVRNMAWQPMPSTPGMDRPFHQRLAV